MGMDIDGKNPENEMGESFRNNVWGWHPLWDYCCIVAPELCAKVKHGHSNDGDGLDADDSKKLSSILMSEIESGRTAEYEKSRDARLTALPDKKCKYCDDSGARNDLVGIQNGLNKPGGCNMCHGTGKIRPFETNYGFDVENVKSFAAFLSSCGGFEIL